MLRSLACALGLCAGLGAPFSAGCQLPADVARPLSWREVSPGLEVAELDGPNRTLVRALRFDQARHQLQLFSPAGGLHLPEALAPLPTEAIWNGGYFERDLQPSGLLIDHGRQVAPPSAGSAMLLLGERCSLVRFREVPSSGLRESALQIWPFLIEPGGGDGIRRDDRRRARRSAIGLDDAGRGVLIGVTGEGITLFQLMAIARRLGLVVAANLDGGPSTGFALNVAPGWREPTQTAVANALVVVARGGEGELRPLSALDRRREISP